MATEAQIEANRANAQKSTGPVTDAGKKRASLNALRHGLTGQVTIMTEEERGPHTAFTMAIVRKYAPKGPVETQYAQLIAQDHWRLNRIVAVEEATLALGQGRFEDRNDVGNNAPIHTAFIHAKVFRRDAKQMQLLSLYESRIRRNLEKNEKTLAAMQAQRQAELANALEEAELLAELAAHENRAFDPQAFGFVFSLEEITTGIEKKKLLIRARQLRNKPQALPAMQAA
jgi:hypothetical protein